jgi:1-acyl-sn-glycerol-3-phosphate acyltransferase
VKLLRFIVRAAVVLPLIIFGLFCVTLVYPIVSYVARNRLNRYWSIVLMRACGMRITVRGEPCMSIPVFWVANHVSWIDIFVLNTVRNTVFVAKSEIRNWPLVGRLVAGGGTLFIERGQRHALQTMNLVMQERFQRGDAVGVFPEGTTSEGFSLLPFHAGLFEPARAADVTMQPIAFRYYQHGRRSGFAAFVGQETLVGNLWRILGATGLEVELIFLPTLTTHHPDGTQATRQELSGEASQAIAAQL